MVLRLQVAAGPGLDHLSFARLCSTWCSQQVPREPPHKVEGTCLRSRGQEVAELI